MRISKNLMVLSALMSLVSINSAHADTSCKPVKIAGYTNTSCLVEGLITVEKDKKWGFVDKTGKIIIPLKYDRVGDVQPKNPKLASFQGFSEGLASVMIKDTEKDAQGSDIEHWGYINTTGKEVIPLMYSDANQFSEGVAFVANQHRKWGVIDKNNKTVIPFKFDGTRLSKFSEGLSVVEEDVIKGYIDKKGKFVIPPMFFEGDSFYKGYAYVNPSPRDEGCIDRKGNSVSYKKCQGR